MPSRHDFAWSNTIAKLKSIKPLVGKLPPRLATQYGEIHWLFNFHPSGSPGAGRQQVYCWRRSEGGGRPRNGGIQCGSIKGLASFSAAWSRARSASGARTHPRRHEPEAWPDGRCLRSGVQRAGPTRGSSESCEFFQIEGQVLAAEKASGSAKRMVAANSNGGANQFAALNATNQFQDIAIAGSTARCIS